MRLDLVVAQQIQIALVLWVLLQTQQRIHDRPENGGAAEENNFKSVSFNFSPDVVFLHVRVREHLASIEQFLHVDFNRFQSDQHRG